MADIITIDPEAAARAVANVGKLSGLVAAYTEREAARRTAESEVARIERAWGAGDSTPTAQDHILATTEVTRSSELAKRAGHQLKALHNSAPVQSFKLAAEVARRIAELYGETRTIISDRLPVETPKVGNNPVLYLIQSRETNDEGGGALAADVDLALFGRSRIVAAPPREDIEATFKAMGWFVDVSRRDPEQTGGVWVSVVNLRIKRAWMPIPFIDPDRQAKPRYAENRMVATGEYALSDLMGDELSRGAAQQGDRLAEFNPLAFNSSVSTDGDGVTRERLTAQFTIKLRSGSTVELVSRTRAGLVGVFVPGLGVVERVTDGAPDHGHLWAFTFVRREPAPAEDEQAA